MANTDQNITELPIKTASEVLDEDYMLGIDLVEGYQVTTKDFADYAVNRAAISIGGRTQTTASAISEVRTTAGNAQPKESGKGLSANDFTNAYKSKLDGIAAGAEVNVQSDWNASSGDAAILHKPTTISGYGITDAYTKTQVDTSLAAKSDKATTYTKSDVDAIVNTDDDTSEASNPLVIETDAAQYAKKTHLALEPVQDLHGYDHPWPAGGGKNLLDDSAKEVGTFSGVTVSQNSKGQFILNGTATANNNVKVGVVTLPAGSYIFSGMKSTGSSSTFFLNLEPQWNGTSNQNLYSGEYSGTSDAERTYTARIYFRSGQSFSNTIFEPMLRKSTDSADFAPYSNICPITPMGHRNLLPMTVEGIKAANGGASSWNGNVYTINGVSFTILTDSGGNVIGIWVNGTSNARIDFTVYQGYITAGNYLLNGYTPLGNSGLYFTQVGVSRTYDYGRDANGVNITIADDITYIRIGINSGVTADNIIVKPMIRPASDLDSTFVPYGVTRVGAKATGFNIWDEKWEVGDINATTGEDQSGSTIRSINYIPVVSGEVYYIPNPEIARICAYDAKKNFVSTLEFPNGQCEIPNNVSFIRFRTQVAYGTVYNNDLCINLFDASKNGTYEPYTESVSSLDLPETVYGGTLDLETGEVVVDKAYEEFSGNETNYGKQGASHIYVGYIPLSNSAKNSDIATTESAIFNKFKTITKNYDAYVEGDGEIYNNRAYFFAPNASDATDVKNYIQSIGGFTVCYELAIPVTYQLTPQQLALFKGTNVISTNAKTVQVTYRNGELATTGNIVDAVEVAKQNAIGESASYTDARLSTELAPILGNFATAETSPASASHDVGEYLLYNNRLYKVLAAISAGQQLTIGTNIGQTNVAAELASQASAISVLNSQKYDLFNGILLGNANDLDTIKTPGNYRINNASSIPAHAPENARGRLYVYDGTLSSDLNAVCQEYITYPTSITYFRYYKVSTTSWSSWEKRPTRAEVDALNSKLVNSLITQYNTGASNTKLVITLNGQSPIDGIITVYSTNNVSVYGIHAYSANGTSLTNETTVINQNDGSSVDVTTSGTSIAIPLATYRTGAIFLSYASGHAPSISYAS